MYKRKEILLKSMLNDYRSKMVCEGYGSLNFKRDLAHVKQHLKDALNIINSANFANFKDDIETKPNTPDYFQASFEKLYNAIEEATMSLEDFNDAVKEVI